MPDGRMTDRKRLVHTIIAGALFCAVLAVRPFSLSSSQSLSVAAVAAVLYCWVTGCIKRVWVSIALLLFFIFFSGVSPVSILKFPLSSNFYLILASFLLSQSASKSRLTDRIADFLLWRCTTPIQFLLMSFLLNFALMILMPVPYTRVIILTAIFAGYLKKREIPEEASQVITLSIYIASTCVSMLFLNGDVILNYAVLNFASIEVSWLDWAKYMLVPSLATMVLMFFLFPLAFKKDLLIGGAGEKELPSRPPRQVFSREEKLSGFILLLVIALWITEGLHGVAPAIVAVSGVLFMYLLRLLDLKDIRCINVDTMIFLTAAISIGAVLAGNGAGIQAFGYLSRYLPADFLGNGGYNLLVVALITITFHMVLGSVVTTTSVVLPCIVLNGSAYRLSLAITLTAYAAGAIHYILPFHHTTLMLGLGVGAGYTPRQIARYGLFMTVFILPAIALFFIPWWRLCGLI